MSDLPLGADSNRPLYQRKTGEIVPDERTKEEKEGLGTALHNALPAIAATSGAAAGAAATKAAHEFGTMGMENWSKWGNTGAVVFIAVFAVWTYKDQQTVQRERFIYEQTIRSQEREDRAKEREGMNSEIRALASEIRAEREFSRAALSEFRGLISELRSTGAINPARAPSPKPKTP